MRKFSIFNIVATCLLFVSGCYTKIHGILPPPKTSSKQEQFAIGASKVDITPLPGIAMGGYSIVGTTGRGYWTRLYAKSLYFCDSKGQSFVMVSCDLWSVSGGLADRVAELVALQGKHLSREQIVLAATHTHHSPGNFSTSPMYNEFASYRKGFDQSLFDFFAQKIADSIVLAIDNSQPATVEFSVKKVAKVVRNRSLQAFLLNVDSHEILQENAELPLEKVLDFDDDAYRAVDPNLTMVHFRNAKTKNTIAVSGFFAVHPTVMGAKTEVYHADLYGVATTLTEQYLQKQGVKTPIVALFNGAEGDISPNWSARDRRNTMYLGKKLAKEMISALQQPQQQMKYIELSYRFENINLAKRCFELKNIERCTAERPSVGVATVGGATDGRSRLHSFLWREQVKGTRSSEQGTKQPPNNPLRMELPFLARFVLDSLMGQIVPPKNCPLGIYRLGSLTFVTMPGEFTTTLGRRIRNEIANIIPGETISIGLANEYISYFTTPEEYEIQFYEGASTLYGPFSGAFIRKELVNIAKKMSMDNVRTKNKPYSYYPGPKRIFSLEDIGSEPYLLDDGLSNLVQDLETGKPVRSYPHFVWHDSISQLDPSLEHNIPHISLQIKKNDSWQNFEYQGVAENDRGLNFVTVLLRVTDNKSKWGTIWLQPSKIEEELILRFCIQKLGKEVIYSPIFKSN
ncbi:neutral/alkaline non-lysosomal ceramidase N-terminal domain-containing protein [Candidatus Uabimicrobium sp. HlEnr_7]|uniref:neutral/alkaline non-lysosomal ceramidase N-terminal domain-containing protein n=1 Tax=Candidatus Uabimicrobium helgolandensis TaxID=3095367 RepID=UPI00355697CD